MRQLWARGREVVIVAVVFLVVLGISWGVCAAVGHPHDGANRWAVCVAFAVVIATAVGAVVHKQSSARGGIEIEGDDQRVAGEGAHGNVLGNRSSKRAKAPGSARPHNSTDGPVQSAVEGQNITIRGNRNRVAGAGAYDNDFGDDPDVHTS
ncbi:hypothetical protein ACF09H_41210 [Streptomyces sp. NPDC014983]|uniref:hypothetical protein n=1 Tax=Streptomyces sp. NPDC014983 TaxID=3364933 RepID=UPI0036F4D4C7